MILKAVDSNAFMYTQALHFEGLNGNIANGPLKPIVYQHMSPGRGTLLTAL